MAMSLSLLLHPSRMLTASMEQCRELLVNNCIIISALERRSVTELNCIMKRISRSAFLTVQSGQSHHAPSALDHGRRRIGHRVDGKVYGEPATPPARALTRLWLITEHGVGSGGSPILEPSRHLWPLCPLLPYYEHLHVANLPVLSSHHGETQLEDGQTEKSPARGSSAWAERKTKTEANRAKRRGFSWTLGGDYVHASGSCARGESLNIPSPDVRHRLTLEYKIFLKLHPRDLLSLYRASKRIHAILKSKDLMCLEVLFRRG